VARVDILEDVGRSLSPLIDVGQIEGAFVMGLGYWMSEGYTFDHDTGRLDSVGTWVCRKKLFPFYTNPQSKKLYFQKYKIPGVKDIPEDMRIYFRKDAPNMKGVLQTKGVLSIYKYVLRQ
jgi:xanthine dehydrogenase/oxidase